MSAMNKTEQVDVLKSDSVQRRDYYFGLDAQIGPLLSPTSDKQQPASLWEESPGTGTS